MIGEFSKSLNESEIEELSEFLSSDETPDECMDISMLDGFLTAIVIGPETITLNRWIPGVCGATDKDEMSWKSVERTGRIMDLILRHYNSIVQSFQTHPPDFSPLFTINSTGEGEITIIDEWCMGFMNGVNLAHESWQPIFEHKEGWAPIFPIYMYGTREGWKALEEDPKISQVSHEEWVAMLPKAVNEIHQFWLPFRQAEAKISHATSNPKPGRD